MIKMPNILFICGSLNQTTMMHAIAQELDNCNTWFTPYYADDGLRYLVRAGLLDFTILGGRFRRQTEAYLFDQQLLVDYGGVLFDYDLVVTCSDLIIPGNIRQKRIVLVQEGMTDPENWMYHLVKKFNLPRYLASTSTTGLSDAYEKFCVASEGYRDLFIRKGAKREKLVVTGIPNFDNCAEFTENEFPYRGYVLVATSDTRETFKWDNRKKLIRQAIEIAHGRQLIFKLHPNEHFQRSAKEIKSMAPDALVLQDGNTGHMIANCEVLITQYSSVAFVGLALDKEVYSYFDLADLKRKLPVQNGGKSAENIAQVCREMLDNYHYKEKAVA